MVYDENFDARFQYLTNYLNQIYAEKNDLLAIPDKTKAQMARLKIVSKDVDEMEDLWFKCALTPRPETEEDSKFEHSN